MFKLLRTVSLLVSLVVAFCVAEAPPLFRSSRGRTSSKQLLARQQAPVAPAPTGYPVAGVTPEIPFDLPTSTVKPDVAYLPPENTYGPPPPQPEATYGPPEPHNTYGPPDNTYLPPESDAPKEVVAENEKEPEAEAEPEVEEEEQQPTAPEADLDVPTEQEQDVDEEDEEGVLVTIPDNGPVIAVSNSFDSQGATVNGQQLARLVYQRFPQSRRSTPADVPVPARLIEMRHRMAPAKLRLSQSQSLAQPQAQPQSFSFVSQYTAW